MSRQYKLVLQIFKREKQELWNAIPDLEQIVFDIIYNNL